MNAGSLKALHRSISFAGIALLISAQPVISATVPTLSASFSGTAVPVFDTKTQSCEATDTPDTPARAYKDSNGVVHLHASIDVNRAMTGNNLLAAKRNCNVVMKSKIDTDPSHFAEYQWLTSFYTSDGINIAALVHNEYHGEMSNNCLATPANAPYYCWYNSITFAQSTNGGRSFAEAAAPANLVATLPYKFNQGLDGGPVGYNSPTGIVKQGQFYYAMINDWPFKDQAYGPCLIRTNNVFDPTSWRAYNGKNFSVQFANPYVMTNITTPKNYVCTPVGAGSLGEVQSLVYNPSSKTFITTQYTPDNRWGAPGLYLSASYDMINWSKPFLVESNSNLTAEQPAGNWLFEYFSLLDPASTDMSFSTITSNPQVYYIRLDQNHGPYQRVLYRRPISITVK